MPRDGIRRQRRLLRWLVLGWLAVPLLPAFAALSPGLKIAYELDVRHPSSHLFPVSITVEGVQTPYLDFSFPAWMPGYSKIQDFAKNVQEFAAVDGKGRPSTIVKLDKQTWRVPRGGDGAIKVDYKVYANNLANINIASHLDETHAFFNGAAIFCYVIGAKDIPVTLRIRKREDWKIATGLEKTKDDAVYRAGSYDVLVDCPTEIGPFAGYDFQVDGIAHHIALYGLQNFDAGFITEDIARIVKACSRLFGGLPYRDYTFIYHLTDRERRSGVEHANSTAIIFNQQDFKGRRKYDDFLEVTAHEFLHLWNIKRIHPEGWGPFDYEREAYTKSHWFTEGLTSYYAPLILVRSGLWTPEKFYQDIAAKMTEHENAPGKKLMSLEQASWDIWLRPDNAPMTTISYYVKGAVVGLWLDLEIRRRSGGKRSMDDVLRHLDRSFGQTNHAYKNDDLLKAINQVSGSDFSDFYGKFVSGTSDLLANDIPALAGLEFVAAPDPPAPSLGIQTQRTPDNFVRIQNVIPGTSGSESGLDIDDLILALNNERVSFDNWPDLLNRQKIGDVAVLTLFHRDRMITKSVTVDGAGKTRYILKEIDKPTPEQLRTRLSLFGDASSK